MFPKFHLLTVLFIITRGWVMCLNFDKGCRINITRCTSIDEFLPCGLLKLKDLQSQNQKNHGCEWEITADEADFINLTIIDFDVPGSNRKGGEGSCMFDHVSVFDGKFDVRSERPIGRFCNNQRPPAYILSPWNKLRIVFNIAPENGGRGFTFTIRPSKFTLPSNLRPYLIPQSSDACPNDWSYYKKHCYRVYKDSNPLHWHKAEAECKEVGHGHDCHLVSILDENEMKVVHYFLTSVWKAIPNTSFYIGLWDAQKEGQYRWSDGNAMSYTDWAKGGSFGGEQAPQPDGGAYEDCTIIRFDSLHSTQNWHDIPCSFGRNKFQSNLSGKYLEDRPIDSYICKRDEAVNQSTSRQPLYDPKKHPSISEIRRFAVKEKYFTCDKLEVISVLKRCDGTPTCLDLSDESGCSVDSDKCLPHQFKCGNGRCIAIAYTCNFEDDCNDGSDEKNCRIRPCKSSTEFKCKSGQCIPLARLCDLTPDCKDGSDEGQTCSGYCNPQSTFQCYYGICIPLAAVCDRHVDCPGKFHEDERESSCLLLRNQSMTSLTSREVIVCQSGQIIDAKYRCINEVDQYFYQIGCRDVTHLRGCEDFKCPKDYTKCPHSYCIPTRYICDGKRDCIGGEDEAGCAHFTCPGQYKCLDAKSCILLHQLCDSVRHCPKGDDEWFCDLTCPSECECISLYVNCAGNNFTRLPANLTVDIRKLDLTHNQLGPTMDSVDFEPYYYLVELILQWNGIEILRGRKFALENLQTLDLRNNKIITIEQAAFAGLPVLNSLLLDGNPNITTIESSAFTGLADLRFLNISNTNVRELKKDSFKGLTNLQELTFGFNNLVTVESGSFTGLNSVITLDLRGNDIRNFKKDMFTPLESLRYLKTSSFKFCCIVATHRIPVPFERCLPPPDEISDCEDLMSSPLQRTFLWILGLVALGCNLIVIVWRLRIRTSANKVATLLILSLGCADFLMGIYMLTIASVDSYYRGRYIEVSDVWRTSILCKVCGFLSTVSTEASVFTLVFITIDRLICICFPFSKYRLTLKLTIRLVIASWVIALLISSLPLVAKPYFKDQFYSRSGVCLALHITNENPAGWEYSVAVFLFLNLIAFLIIFTCYVYMYKVILESQRRMSQVKTKQVRERQIGRQMALIVGSNFLCWFPIIVMGLLAINGYRLPATVYSWTAVFVLPLNSATNPVVYTFAELWGKLFKPKRRDSLTRSLLISKHSVSVSQRRAYRPYKAPLGYTRLTEFLKDSETLEARHILQIACSLCEQIKEVHERGFALGGIEAENVFVSSLVDSRHLKVYLPDYNAYKVSDETDDWALDIEEFGTLVKRMLRLYTFRRNLSFKIDHS